MIRVLSQAISEPLSNNVDAYHYNIAGQQLVFLNQVASLKEFESGPVSFSYQQLFSGRKPQYERLSVNNASLIYFGRAPFNNKTQDLRYWRKQNIAQIDVAGTPVCQVDFATDQIYLLNARSFDERLNLEVVTGPALITLLAKHNVYCLHAGAVSTSVGNIVLIAESGTGKSTLSAHTSVQDPNYNWRQITDDILPLSTKTDGGQASFLLPDFPQLKLPNAVPQSRVLRDRNLDYILRLNPEPSESIEFRALPRTEAMLQVVRHTVAAKLFGDSTMRRHARFAKNVSRNAPVFEVSYPRNLNALPDLRKRIIDYLHTQKCAK